VANASHRTAPRRSTWELVGAASVTGSPITFRLRDVEQLKTNVTRQLRHAIRRVPDPLSDARIGWSEVDVECREIRAYLNEDVAGFGPVLTLRRRLPRARQ
jgi:hypothetical protein